MKKLIIALSLIDLLIIGFSRSFILSMVLQDIDIIMAIVIIINAIIIITTRTRKLLIFITVATVVQFICCITAVDDVNEADVDLVEYHHWRMEYFMRGSRQLSDNTLSFLDNYFELCLFLLLLLQLVIFGWAIYTLWLKRIS